MGSSYTRGQFVRKVLCPIPSTVDGWLDLQRSEHMLRYGRYLSDAAITRAALEGLAQARLRVGELPHPSRLTNLIAEALTRPAATSVSPKQEGSSCR